MVRSMFNTVTGKKIAIFGFAFKKDTGDTRETAAAFIARDLVEEQARVHVYDPQVSRESMFAEFKYTLNLSEETKPGLGELVVTSPDAYSAAQGAHAIAIARVGRVQDPRLQEDLRPLHGQARVPLRRPQRAWMPRRCARSASRFAPSASPWAQSRFPAPRSRSPRRCLR